ncbi:DUF2254 domain-containing protein [Roseomonas genomospecies 6]|uniref:DUF2254 domain-containing protein n=2 Tax=Roseomonas genomospecies 6 TaxID=214106 RepID=A0A9W7KMZ2_9PROT|nr:DUF2254 domain-containing protein [Roseomonas genomospecies 6]
MGAAMRDRIRHYWAFLHTSLWFVPVLMGVAAVFLAVALLTWGRGVLDDATGYWLLYAGDAGNARELLSSLLTGMITMTSLVVSITMVVLTLAAGQIGPRLIRNFIQDWTTQVVLGLFLADIIYLLVVFRTIDGTQADTVPHLAVSVGTGLTAFCLFVLLVYVHKLARSIIYDNVVQRVAADLRAVIADRLPERDDEVPETPPNLGGDFVWVDLGQDGYVQAVDLDALVAAACRADAVIRLDVRPGHYVIGGGEHVAVFPAGACTKEMRGAIRGALIVGSERTPTQDVEFGIRQLVEMATRALSPGINDVFTALAVIDNLSASLARILDRGIEPAVLRDSGGAIRLVRDVSGYEGFVGAAFDQIRQAGSGNAAVLIRLIDAIIRLAPRIRSDAQRDALREQLTMILTAGEQTISIPRDLNILKCRWRQADDRLTR